eukprot:COSAG02_NODE_168_length_31711_cov_68.337973_25_plen_66_part_00
MLESRFRGMKISQRGVFNVQIAHLLLIGRITTSHSTFDLGRLISFCCRTDGFTLCAQCMQIFNRC